MRVATIATFGFGWVRDLGWRSSVRFEAVNRLGSASEQPTGGGAVTWSQFFGFDDFGNNWVSAQAGALPRGGPRPNLAAWYQMAGTSGTVVDNRTAGEQYDRVGNQTSLGALTSRRINAERKDHPVRGSLAASDRPWRGGSVAVTDYGSGACLWNRQSLRVATRVDLGGDFRRRGFG